MRYTILDAKTIDLNGTHVAILKKYGKNNYASFKDSIVVTVEEYKNMIKREKKRIEEYQKMKIDILSMLLNDEI